MLDALNYAAYNKTLTKAKKKDESLLPYISPKTTEDGIKNRDKTERKKKESDLFQFDFYS